MAWRGTNCGNHQIRHVVKMRHFKWIQLIGIRTGIRGVFYWLRGTRTGIWVCAIASVEHTLEYVPDVKITCHLLRWNTAFIAMIGIRTGMQGVFYCLHRTCPGIRPRCKNHWILSSSTTLEYSFHYHNWNTHWNTAWNTPWNISQMENLTLPIFLSKLWSFCA